MQFQVPQFIEVEDKIFGPFTFKQFIYMAGGAGLAYVFWRLLPIFIAGPIVLAIGGFTVALAFMQYNGRPFLVALETAFYYFLHTKLYLWNNKTQKRMAQVQKGPTQDPATLFVPKLSDSRIHELAWSLDIKERVSAGFGSDDDRRTLQSNDALNRILTPRTALKNMTSQ